MGKIISIHSFRGGTGKSNLTANLAVQVAARGHRVGIVDTDIQSPGIHVLFGLDEHTITKALNDFLWGNASIDEVAYPLHELTTNDPERAFLRQTKLWLLPSSIRTEEITRILQEGYNVSILNQGFHSLMTSLGLDYLFIDTHPGLNEETLLSIAISHGLLIIMRPDQQDFQGTAVTVDIARQLEVPEIRLIVNKALSRYDPAQVKAEMEANYGIAVAGVLPLSEDVASNASHNIFSMLQPNHPWSKVIVGIVDQVIAFKGEYSG
jgi:MinD-like ATPase involved in chromosome partitioning or flagellar assembly